MIIVIFPKKHFVFFRITIVRYAYFSDITLKSVTGIKKNYMYFKHQTF